MHKQDKEETIKLGSDVPETIFTWALYQASTSGHCRGVAAWDFTQTQVRVVQCSAIADMGSNATVGTTQFKTWPSRLTKHSTA